MKFESFLLFHALSDHPRVLNCGRYSGFYKGVQSAGAAVAWQIDNHKTPLLSQLIVNWSLTTLSYPLLVVLVLLAVKDEDTAEDGESKMPNPSALPGSVDDSLRTRG